MKTAYAVRDCTKWHERFTEDYEDMEDEKRSVQRTTLRTDENKKNKDQNIQTDCRLSVQMIYESTDIDKDTLCKILWEYLNMKQIYSKMLLG